MTDHPATQHSDLEDDGSRGGGAVSAAESPALSEDAEAAFRAADALFVNPTRRVPSHAITLVSLGLFAGVWFLQNENGSLWGLVTLVGVLLFHELGHALTMRLSGYMDVRVFFIPFVGAAAAGRASGVAPWKQALVLLMGPLPGIFAGTLLMHASKAPSAHAVALEFLAINAFNLIPIAPLDGGRLFSTLVFSRQRHLEVAVHWLASVALMASAFFGHWVLAVLGFIMFSQTRAKLAAVRAAHGIRRLGLPESPAALDEAERRRLYQAVHDELPPEAAGRPKLVAQLMEEVLERATWQPVSWSATSGLLLLWLVGWAISLVGFAAVEG